MSNPFRTQDTTASRGRGGGVVSVSAGAPPLPPHIPQLAHWWDFTGIDSIFND